MNKIKKKQIIGRREFIDFPELGLHDILAKVDTGAYTSALYCHEIRMENGVLFFKLLDPSYACYQATEQIFHEFGEKYIKNSFGEVEKRFTIKTIVKIGRRQINSVISLTDRSEMRYPVLLGRKILNNRFIIDVSLVNTLHPIK